MKLKKTVLACVLLLAAIAIFAQKSNQKKADDLFHNFSFYKATDAYKKLIENNIDIEHASRQLADCYAFMRNPDSANVYYEKVVQQNNVPVEYFYSYAQTLRGIKNYEASRFWLDKYKKAGGSTDTSIFSNDTDFINYIFNAQQQYFLKNVIFNTEFSEFGAYQKNEKIYFTSTRDQGVSTKFKSGWDNQPFLDVYVTETGRFDSIVNNKSKIKGKINSVYHDGPLTITNDGKTMYFSRNNFNKNILKTDNQEIGNLKIYRATLIKNKWKKIKELSFNSDAYSTAHPALNNDGTKLYFTSDMPGGLGGTDIYYVDIKPNGSVGKPKNLGPIVNTKKNESFPFINSENALFFSSDGHLGLGLLDVFGAVTNEKNTITSVLNLGIPVNSSKDDFSFFMSQDGLSGYFASNRNGGVGSDDIYAFDRKPILKIDGLVKDIDGIAIPDAMGKVLNSDGHQVATIQTDKNGRFEVNIDRNTDYIIKLKKENYIDESKNVTSKGIDKNTTYINKDFLLNAVAKKVPIITEFQSIYFEYNTFELNEDSKPELDKIAHLMMNTHPNMIIKIESHTDARGSIKFNDVLSSKRANATYNYLISKGVDATRIIEYTGYGEQNLLNDCGDTANCTEMQHQLNRRTQIIIVTME